MRDSERSSSQYDAMAVHYAADNAISSYNSLYERPATIALLGDVRGQRVLEAGCGAGVLTRWLADHGAEVTAFDVSEQMVTLAATVVGGRASFQVADLDRPLAFATDRSFDLIVGSLVLHYVRDWAAVFQEFHRVLRPGGAVVFSTHHPTMDWQHSPEDYFAITQVTETWHKGGRDFEVTFWRRPLTAMTADIAASGFVIEQLVEPRPSEEMRERDPQAYEAIRASPRFLFFRLRALPSETGGPGFWEALPRRA